MACSLKSSFVGCMPVSSISKVAEPCTRSRLHLRVVSESPSTVMLGREGNLVKPGTEVSRLLGTGIQKPGELWWAPLYSVSAEEQWDDLLSKQGTKKETKQGTSASTRLAPAGSTAIALPDLVESQSNGSRRNSARVAFTAEKARALRKSLRASDTWHDGWYHSAIATRLAEHID